MFTDFVLNGQGNGPVGEMIGAVRFDPNLLRPFIETDPNSAYRGRPCCNINTGRFRSDDKGRPVPIIEKWLIKDLQAKGINSPVFNATTLTRDAWVHLDNVVVKANRQRLRAWTDLMAASSVGGFNAMGKMTYEYQAINDVGEAIVDMDAVAEGRGDTPLIKPRSVPLPITHSDFYYTEREIAVSRNSGVPLDTTMAEQAGRRVAEMIEKTLIGTETGITYGTQSTEHDGASKIWGYTNFTHRVQKTDLTAPTGTNPEAVMTDILEMIETMQGNGYFGPYILYHSTGYSRYFNDDYFRTGSTSAVRSLRERLMEIEGISDIRRLDYLTSGYQLILVQMTSDVVQAINGMEPTLVQWDEKGGLLKKFKVMAIQVGILKAPYNGTAGIIHGTTS